MTFMVMELCQGGELFNLVIDQVVSISLNYSVISLLTLFFINAKIICRIIGTLKHA